MVQHINYTIEDTFLNPLFSPMELSVSSFVSVIPLVSWNERERGTQRSIKIPGTIFPWSSWNSCYATTNDWVTWQPSNHHSNADKYVEKTPTTPYEKRVDLERASWTLFTTLIWPNPVGTFKLIKFIIKIDPCLCPLTRELRCRMLHCCAYLPLGALSACPRWLPVYLWWRVHTQRTTGDGTTHPQDTRLWHRHPSVLPLPPPLCQGRSKVIRHRACFVLCINAENFAPRYTNVMLKTLCYSVKPPCVTV